MNPRFWRRIGTHPFGIAGGILLAVFALSALFAPWLSTFSPTATDFDSLLQPPNHLHPFGTDALGRDVLARTLYGGRVSLVVGFTAVTLAMLVGGLWGLVAGYFRGWLDSLLMRFVDALLAFPFLVLALTLAAVLGPGLFNTILAISIVTAPSVARLVRGQVLAEIEKDYVVSAVALGASHARIVFRHVLPNLGGPLIVQGSLSTANAILAESTLSFLGLGIQPPTPSWGSMLNEARGYVESAPWLAIFPGLAIFIAVLSFNLLGDALRDAFDPRTGRG
ncbi:peptide ABC transporter permease [Thermus scotoductus]|jgi:peptide/nickel transport system permease protein|uniref:Peptide ABC transporter permease n=1 Tax=Thermus scotoductus TaxID=37636 RepID=A0A430VL04_THESC|nr:ABC transporter permease [Thermus scotoductus]RTI52546.1 peptide ABC transporter permease [Thermus scotoductus]